MPKITPVPPFQRLININGVIKEIKIDEQTNPDNFRNFYPKMTQALSKGHWSLVNMDMLNAFEKEFEKQFKQYKEWFRQKKKEVKEASV